jgi:tetratricopeptide (TPR) repeat protein
LRDEALTALDAGDPRAALASAGQALAVLDTAGARGGLDHAAVLIALAEIEEELDRFGDAEVTIAAAVAILAEVADSDLDTLMLWCQAQQLQAGLERLAGNFAAAATRLTAVLDHAADRFGEASPAVVSAANALGVVHRHAGDFTAAEAAYSRAAAAADGLAEPDPLTRATLLHNLGGLAHSRCNPEAGIPLAEQGLALRAAALGAGHPDVARDLNALGALYHLAGRYSDAAQACQQSLAIFEEHYGPDGFEVAQACANLAVLHSDQGQLEAAEALGRRSLAILEAVLGPEDAEVGLTLLNLAAAVAGQGRRECEVAVLTARATAILTARLPAGHPHVLAAHQALRDRRPAR